MKWLDYVETAVKTLQGVAWAAVVTGITVLAGMLVASACR